MNKKHFAESLYSINFQNNKRSDSYPIVWYHWKWQPFDVTVNIITHGSFNPEIKKELGRRKVAEATMLRGWYQLICNLEARWPETFYGLQEEVEAHLLISVESIPDLDWKADDVE